MQVNRSASTPYFREYITHFAVSDPDTAALPEVIAERAQVFTIPTFQRGISWDTELLELFVASKSSLLGTVIFGQVEARVPVLIDGLQRFCVGTALLNTLYPLVLSPEPERGGLAHFFKPLSDEVRTFEFRFSHNHGVLRSFSRVAVRRQYRDFANDVATFVRANLSGNAEEFGTHIVSLFLDRQVAIDVYSNIATMSQLLKSFIGLNTVRQELSTVDIIRTALVDKAMAQGWQAADISEMENLLTTTFVQDNGNLIRSLVPLATLVDYDLDSHHILFPNWAGLTPANVAAFLTYISSALTLSETPASPWLHALRTAGALPLAIAMLYFYIELLREFREPTDEQVSEDAVRAQLAEPASIEILRLLYRATVRRVVNGDIGRTGKVAESLLSNPLRVRTMRELADQLNPVDAGALDANPSNAWLVSSLRACGRDSSKTIFNAYILPAKELNAEFAPLEYGRRATQYQIDHIIPGSQQALEGANDILERLPNFCPLISTDNVTAKHMLASQKLSAGGLYATTTRSTHPYVKWLSEHQGGLGADLDRPILLSEARDPAVGDDRIAHLANHLGERI